MLGEALRSRTAVARLRRPAELRPLRRRHRRDVPPARRPDRDPGRPAARDPRGDRVGPARPGQPGPRERAAHRPVSRDHARRRDPAGLDRADHPGRRRRHATRGRDRIGLVADRDPRAAVPVQHLGRRGGRPDRALRDRDRSGHRRRADRAVSRPAGARLDAQHPRGLRGRPRARRAVRPAGSPAGDLLLRPDGLQPADRGARRRGGGRPRGTRRAAGPAGVGRPWREGRQVARRRRDVPFPRAGAGRPGRARHARRRRDRPAAVGPHRDPCRARCSSRKATTSGGRSTRQRASPTMPRRDQVLVSQEVVDAAAARGRRLRLDRTGRAEGPARAAGALSRSAATGSGQKNAPSGRADGA